MRHSLLFAALVFSAGILGVESAAADSQTTAKIAQAMSGYHFQAKPDALEQIAGGEDQLVAALLELRTNSVLPFVAIRAERLLLIYADRDDVHAALLEDVNSEEHKGLARTIAAHIDRAPERARRSLGRAAVQRAQRDKDFGTYARSMSASTDPEIRTMARSLGE